MKNASFEVLRIPNKFDYVRVVLLRGKEVLVITQPDGHFVFPGGRVEEGESVIQALPRELLEELSFGPDHIAMAMLGILATSSNYYVQYGNEFVMVCNWSDDFGPGLPPINLREDTQAVGWYSLEWLRGVSDYPNFNYTLELVSALLYSGTHPLFSSVYGY